MLKRMMIMQALIAVLGQFIMGSTAIGITLIDAEQQVRARSCYTDTGNGTEYIAALELDPEFPQGLGNAYLSASVSKNGADGSASLTSRFKKNQVKVSCSTEAIAQWGEHPEEVFSVRGNSHGEFHLRFTTGPSPAYIQIDGLLNVNVTGDPGIYPEETRAWLRLERIDDGQLTRIWTAELDGADPQTSLAVDDVISLEAEREYFLIALAESSAPAWWEKPSVKVREASYSFNATIEPTPEVEITGPPAIALFYPIWRSPQVVLNAQGDPPGGEYEWTIVSGQDKLQFVGNTHGKVVRVKGKAPSEYLSDVVIKVTYTVNSQSCEALHEMTVQKPTLLKVVEGYPEEPVIRRNDVGQVIGYSVLYAFQVFDQLVPAKPINTDRMFIWEVKELCYRNYNIGHIFPFDVGRTTEDGCFDDELGTPDRPRIVPLPEDLFMKVNQWIWVEGWQVPPRCQVYYYDEAISVEGSCTGCQ